MHKKYKKSLTLTLFCALALTTASVFSQNCNTVLQVEKNRNFKSADEDGAVFNLVLKNQSSAKNTYTIATKFLPTACNNDTYQKTSPNVSLANHLLSSESKSLSNNMVELLPGQTYSFKVMVEAPSNNDYGKWSCIEVSAVSSNCKEAATTVLSVYLADPTEE